MWSAEGRTCISVHFPDSACLRDTIQISQNMADQQYQPRDEALIATLREAWVSTRMEKDKTLLALATGGIGLLTTLSSTVGPSSNTELILYVVAGVSFGVAVVVAVMIFDRNSTHIENVLNNAATEDKPLKWMDRTLLASFLIGLALTGAIAFTSGRTHIRKAELMAKDRDDSGKVERSLNGIGKVGNTGASLNGIGKLGEGAGSGGASTGTGTGSGSGGTQQGDKK